MPERAKERHRRDEGNGMSTLAEKLLELRNFVVEHGAVVDHAECDITGNRDSITSYSVEGKRITFTLHNGAVAAVITR